MKLMHAAASPFVRKCMVLLEEAGQRDAVEIVDGMGSPVAPNDDVLAANPVGKIPCLILDDGSSVYDSRVITRYLDSKFNLGMYPQGDAAWKTLTLEAHADAMLDAAILCVYEIRCRDAAHHSPEWVDGQRRKVTGGLAAPSTILISAQRWVVSATGERTVRSFRPGGNRLPRDLP